MSILEPNNEVDIPVELGDVHSTFSCPHDCNTDVPSWIHPPTEWAITSGGLPHTHLCAMP